MTYPNPVSIGWPYTTTSAGSSSSAPSLLCTLQYKQYSLGWPYTTTSAGSSSSAPSLLYTVLDVVGLVQDWHLEYQNGPLVVVDRYIVLYLHLPSAMKTLQCCGSESERIRKFWPNPKKNVRIRIQTLLKHTKFLWKIVDQILKRKQKTQAFLLENFFSSVVQVPEHIWEVPLSKKILVKILILGSESEKILWSRIRKKWIRIHNTGRNNTACVNA
jgi:hypothetical protein